MTLENVEAADVLVMDVDEDIFRAFRTEVGWVLVCETSVRLLANWQEISRVELPDIVRQAEWDDGVLVVRDDEGAAVTISNRDGTLNVVP
jgi:hypothetical protein